MSRAHSLIFTSIHLRHSSFSNPSVALLTSQLILQPFRCFTYISAHSPTLFSLLLRHWLFTYVTWRAAHDISILFSVSNSVKFTFNTHLYTFHHKFSNKKETNEAQQSVGMNMPGSNSNETQLYKQISYYLIYMVKRLSCLPNTPKL